MIDRSRIARISGVLLMFGVGAVLAPRQSWADMVLTDDGKWQPLPEGQTLGADDMPTDEMLAASADFKVDAGYDVVKSNRGFSKPAGKVLKIVSSDRGTNEKYRQAFADAESQFFQEAADGFLAASQELQGFGKQSALWDRVQAYARAGSSDKAVTACDDLLTAFPKSYFFADAQILKARVYTAKGDSGAAQKALDAVKNAAGMNARDLYRAEYNRIFLLLESQKKSEEAGTDYRKLVEAIEKDKDALQGATTRQEAMVGLGNSLFAMKKLDEAKGFYDKATDSRNADVLAGAYAGLGDVSLMAAKALREGGKLKEAKDKLEEAVLHYLRVTVKYRLEAEEIGPVARALENQARVFVTLFEMSGSKDCELANNAYSAYVDLSKMLPDGPQKRSIVRDALAFNEKRQAACGVPK